MSKKKASHSCPVLAWSESDAGTLSAAFTALGVSFLTVALKRIRADIVERAEKHFGVTHAEEMRREMASWALNDPYSAHTMFLVNMDDLRQAINRHEVDAFMIPGWHRITNIKALL